MVWIANCLAWCSIVMLFVYPLGIPAFYLYVLHRHKRHVYPANDGRLLRVVTVHTPSVTRRTNCCISLLRWAVGGVWSCYRALMASCGRDRWAASAPSVKVQLLVVAGMLSDADTAQLAVCR